MTRVQAVKKTVGLPLAKPELNATEGKAEDHAGRGAAPAEGVETLLVFGERGEAMTAHPPNRGVNAYFQSGLIRP